MTDPMERTCSNDRYYLVAYSKKHNNFTHYSVGRMEKVEVEDVTNEYDKERFGFNINAYRKQAFGMYAGAEREVELTVDNDCVDAIIDRFGENVEMRGGVN